MGRLTRNTSPAGELADERFSRAFVSDTPYPDGAIFVGVDEPHFGAVFAEAIATRQPLVVVQPDGQELIGRPDNAGFIFTARPLDPSTEKQGRSSLSRHFRFQLLSILQEKIASPHELAKELNQPLGDVTYQFRMLYELELIDLVKTEQSRGAVIHYYRASDPPQAPEEPQE
ncbi:MAG TPA: winged helix-turn-helix domain-containing protein [Solirubrobacterales bacterium]|nr:winged helix-turn-helix domain-containing protein [Solirubrobacterales bacterium]